MKPYLRTFLLANLVSALVLPSMAKPNFIVIFIDDMGYGDIGPFGSKKNETPHLDRMAKEGMKLTSFYLASSVCTPSRAALMTGSYPRRVGLGKGSGHGVLFPGDPHGLHPKEVTIAEMLKDAGYATGCFGKWHLGDQPEFLPTSQGFDEYVGIPYSNDMWVGLKRWKFPHLPILRGTKVIDQVKDMDGQADLCRLFTVEAVKFIEKNKDKPFFLYLTHYAVHTPIQAKSELKKKYQAKKPTERHKNAAYAAMIESTDDSVGAVLGKLEELGLDENTIVLFFSDNGGHGGVTSNAPLRGSKGMLYEGGIREPMIVKWPGVTKPGSVCKENVIGVDFYPTLLEVTNSPTPKDYLLDGVSLVPLLKNAKAKLERKAIHWHFPAYLQGYTARHGHFRTTPAGAVRIGDWKLIEFFEDGTLELYNTGKDLSETKNLAKKMPEKAKELHEVMLAWRKDTKAPVPTKLNPAYDPKAAKAGKKIKK